MSKRVSVRISGVRGKVDITPDKGATVADVVAAAAQVLGLNDYDPSRAKLLVDGAEVEADTPVVDGTKVDAAPAARLG